MDKAYLIRLLLQTLSLENRIQGSIDMSANLEIFMLHHVIQYFDDADFRCKLLALVLALAPE